MESEKLWKCFHMSTNWIEFVEAVLQASITV